MKKEIAVLTGTNENKSLHFLFNTWPGFFVFVSIITLTRLPFLFDGYGAEEDSWGMINALMRISASGVYEASRFPGHPVVEAVFFYALPFGPFFTNLLTALFSSAGIYFFALALIKLNVKHFFPATMALAFTPVVYVNACNNMDYLWALSFMMMCLFFFTDHKFITAGIFLALAAGCRITSLALILPLVFLFFHLHYSASANNRSIIKSVAGFFAALIITTLICFARLIKTYGLSFITHPDTLGYPQWAKTFYKMSFGVFGVIGLIALVILLWPLIKAVFNYADKLCSKGVTWFTVSGIVIFTAIYFFLPQKATFLIPVLPFLYMLMAVHLKSKNVYALFFALLISNFVAGINLDDDLRGAKSSALAFRAKVMSQPVTFDLLKGSLLAESEKRKQKMAFARQVVKQLYSMHQPALIIAGYWINEIEVLSNHQLNNQIRLVYFSSENELKYYRLNAVACYYLPQQDVVNDLKYNHAFTAHYAKPLFEDNGNDFRY